MASVDWERRRRNIRILLAEQNRSATSLADACGLSPNTLSKFTNGSTQTLSEKTLSKVVEGLGLSSAADLDTDNPINDPRVLLRRIIDDLPEGDLPGLLRELEARFSR